MESGKRLFDIAVSVGMLLLLSPLFLVVSALIKADSRGGVLFRQRRVGRWFRSFDIYKFRTMIENAEELGPGVTAGGDPRITRVGRVLRRSKIDELPQLLNVLLGDMSVVGPRPEVEKYVRHFTDDYREILAVRPGITDIASVMYRDEENMLKGRGDSESFYLTEILPKKIRLARYYVRRRSMLMDARILLATFLSVLRLGDPMRIIADAELYELIRCNACVASDK